MRKEKSPTTEAQASNTTKTTAQKESVTLESHLPHWEAVLATVAELAKKNSCQIVTATVSRLEVEYHQCTLRFTHAEEVLNTAIGTHDIMSPFLQGSHRNWNVLVGNLVELEGSNNKTLKALNTVDRILFLPSSKRTIERIFHSWLDQTKDQTPPVKESLSSQNIRNVLAIARELNGIRDVHKLLLLILEKAIEVTRADAGSVYVVEEKQFEEKTICFKISVNRSRKIHLDEFKIPVSASSIVGNSVLLRKTIHIEDLYKLDPDPTKNPYNASHDVSFDKRNNYECHSMISVPMFDIGDSVIGVIQLINCKLDDTKPLIEAVDFVKNVIPFTQESIDYAEIVAYQAGIALENAILTEEKVAMFDGFVDASVKAIEQRDPTTSGHSHRVADYSLELAEVVNKVTNGTYGNLFFSSNQIKELRYASMLHDFGKLGVREAVLVKSKKLYPWQQLLIEERFELIRALVESKYHKEVLHFIKSTESYPPGVSEESFLIRKNQRLEQLENYFEFIMKANEPTILEKGGFEFLRDIAGHSFQDSRGRNRPYIHSDELDALSVSKGSLTVSEFNEIQSHVTHTYDFLRKIPWGRDLANIPEIAAKHHEKLDGSGYPHSVPAESIPVQSRIIAIADIFDALTASDRPYKKAVPTERALDILEIEVKAGKCDPDLFRLFVEAKCWEKCQHGSLGQHTCSDHNLQAVA